MSTALLKKFHSLLTSIIKHNAKEIEILEMNSVFHTINNTYGVHNKFHVARQPQFESLLNIQQFQLHLKVSVGATEK